MLVGLRPKRASRGAGKVLLLSFLVIAAFLVWSERLPESADADTQDHVTEVLASHMGTLTQQYGMICGESVSSEPDGEQISTGLSMQDDLPTELQSLTARPNAPANWFADRHVDSDSVILVSSGLKRPGTVNGMVIVAEAIELFRYEPASGGNRRWEVVESRILYPCNSDGSPRPPG